MIISGCAEGMVAVSNSASGLVVRVISDHQGAPITDLQSSSNTLMVNMVYLHLQFWSLPSPTSQNCILTFFITQLPSLGVESHLWLVASGDRRVSIWTSEWHKNNCCQQVDWLTFPGPANAPDGTRLKKANKVSCGLKFWG